MTAAEIVPPRSRLVLERGSPSPLGSTPGETGTNFAVYSRHASRITLALFAPGGAPRGELPLDPVQNRTGDVWHTFVPGVRAGAEYGWRADSDLPGPGHAFEPDALLLDPYTKGVAGSERWVGPRTGALRAVVCDLRYDWRGDQRPATAMPGTAIYELHVRAFTCHESSGVRHPGTFAGLAEKAPWLRSLGVTAVQLMPVAEFDETGNPRRNPLTGEPLLDAWGYMPLAFMAPKTSYAADATAAGAIAEFRDMVRALHAAGIEVILDVVYNHTGEGGRRTSPRSWRGLDRASYFVLDAAGRDIDVTGCGHTFACARTAASDMIVDALRFWARDMHVDGFRFDLATTLTRDERGEPLADPPLIRRIASDPLLSHCKLIAEPWDVALEQVGRFPGAGRFAELNGRFRDDVRDWLRGAADPARLALRLGGSPDLYTPAGGASRSVNFVTSHDGFTLADLVRYEQKHNLANGEANRDGTNDHRSWNCGVEGPSDDPAVRAMRARQARNAAVLLVVAEGPLLWLWGDDTLRTQRGNNNPWCQDGPEWWLDWSPGGDAGDFARCVRGLFALRRERGGFRAGGAATDIEWLSDGGRRLAQRFRGVRNGDFVLVANGGDRAQSFRPRAGARPWRLVVNSAADPPGDWTPPATARVVGPGHERVLAPRSLMLLASR